MMEHCGPYLLLTKIASGGMGELFLAKSTKLKGIEKFLVVKKILPHLTGSEELNKLFINEAQVNMNLNHSNIANIFDFGIEQGSFYIAMDYIKGVSLKRLLTYMKSIRELELDEIVFIISQTAKGLSYAHRCCDFSSGKHLNIIHRDVSPDNIMIDVEGNIKIIDFGIATQEKSEKRSTCEGKYSYMSPEQARGVDQLTAQTDIFSLGIVLWELLAQQKLYTCVDKYETLRKAKKAEIPNIKLHCPHLPADLEHILSKALERDTLKRYVSMDCFYDDLRAFLNKNYPRFSQYSLREEVSMVFKQDFKYLTEHLAQVKTSILQNELNTTKEEDKTVLTHHSSSLRKNRRRRRIIKKRRRVKKKDAA